MASLGFDAQPIIAIRKIEQKNPKLLDRILQSLVDIGDECTISRVNHAEVGHHWKRRWKPPSTIKISDPVEPSEFQRFKSEVNAVKITLTTNDMHALYHAADKGCAYLVTGDVPLMNSTRRYARLFGTNLEPLPVVGLMKRLADKGKLTKFEFTKYSLQVFKYDEIDNIVKGVKRDWDERVAREKFQTYKDPILSAWEGV